MTTLLNDNDNEYWVIIKDDVWIYNGLSGSGSFTAQWKDTKDKDAFSCVMLETETAQETLGYLRRKEDFKFSLVMRRVQIG